MGGAVTEGSGVGDEEEGKTFIGACLLAERECVPVGSGSVDPIRRGEGG